MRDLRVRYKQASLGAGWAILQPLAGAAAFTLVFDNIAEVPTPGVPYPLFAYISIAMWTFISTSITSSAQSITSNVDLVTKVYFPRLLLPFAGIIPASVDLAVGLALALPVIPFIDAQLGWEIITLPLWVLSAVVASVAIGLLLAPIQVRFRDVRFLIPLLLQIGLFASPIAYPATAIDQPWRLLYALNPAVAPLEGMRWALTAAPLDVPTIVVSTLAGVLLLVVALGTFASLERRFADII